MNEMIADKIIELITLEYDKFIKGTGTTQSLDAKCEQALRNYLKDLQEHNLYNPYIKELRSAIKEIILYESENDVFKKNTMKANYILANEILINTRDTILKKIELKNKQIQEHKKHLSTQRTKCINDIKKKKIEQKFDDIKNQLISLQSQYKDIDVLTVNGRNFTKINFKDLFSNLLTREL